MKQLTIVASIPPHTEPSILQKVWILRSYLKEEVGINADIVVVSGRKGKPKIIALGEVIDLDEDITTIIRKITASMVYDVGDPEFLNKVAIGSKTS
ncbi:MAG: hypothetical protein J7L55_02255 [Desulfurococcales archaeon]|nr:hypothetical protein [Desulfurococcales archaeon]